jgi:UDP-GlcNAc:undecaprenyl-phosphate/decaprenyl-phosphate GlcNAc-1-phosphate transferase
MTDPWLVAGVAVVSSAALTPLSMALAWRLGVVDRPGALKPQASAVPYLGGLAIFPALVVGAAFAHLVVIAPLGAALALGTLDDAIDLPPWVRLGGQVAIGAGVAASVSTRLPGVIGPVAVGAVTVVLMNGVNFIDGLDGLASGVGLGAAIAFALVLRGGERDLALALAGALVGFLIYNRPPARIYLGDGGAYMVGTAAAVLLAWTWSRGVDVSTSVASLLVVAVPSAEVAFAVVRRSRARHAISSGDRRHPYDLLVARGWSKTASALTYVGAQGVLAAAAVAVAASHELAASVVAVIVAACGLVVVAAACGALGPGAEVAA